MYVPGRKLVSLIFIKFYFQVVPPCKEKNNNPILMKESWIVAFHKVAGVLASAG